MAAPATAPATVGTLRWEKPGNLGRRGAWGISAAPHVMIRVKRLFPRALVSRADVVWLTDTPDVARDIEWLSDRHPLAMTDDVRARLERRAAEHVARGHAVDSIMSGAGALALELEPSRKLRDYQGQAVQLLRETGRMILADDLGLGKTTTALGILGDPDAMPLLVVCPPHLQRQWLRELGEVWPLLRGHIVTKGSPYNMAAARGMGGLPPDVVIMSYSKLAGWVDELAGQFPTVVFDEAHDLRTGDTTNKGAAAARIADGARTVLGLTATPVTNYGDEVHNLYSIIHPDVLGSRAEFLREWGGGQVGNHTKVADPAALGSYLREQGVFLRRTRADVGRELPKALPIYHEIDADTAALAEVTADVQAMARLILDKTQDRDARFLAAGELDLRMRQATGVAKAPYVAQLADLVLQSEDRIVLWGWHRAVYDIWLDRLADYRPVMFTGSESDRQKTDAVREFMSGASRVLIMSLRSGAGLDGLQQVCSTGIFGELDWSPAIMDQCIGRLNRDGQRSIVNAYFPVSDHGSDPVMSGVLQLKSGQAKPLLDPDAPLAEPTQAEAMSRVELLARGVLNPSAARQENAA
ncbi:DEAD/DEAH box helicase [Pseudonocardia sp. NPDC049635]|uniref:DEAD/DEAH box helicase n=1 Tax=Pseudonocardia sp. NPDC049635 TaxID=3155506 RepID=UPI0033CC813F